MGKILQRAIVLLAAIGLTSCSQEETTKQEDPANRPTVPITAGEVKIGDQIWMTKNLSVTRYRNGDVIPQVQDPIEWANLTTGAWCYYENSTANGTTYGKLYNWYAINDPRGLAPNGYHIPTDAEFAELVSTLGGENIAGKAIKAINGWTLSSGITNTNSSGYTALPGGVRQTNGAFYGLGFQGSWWTNSENGSCCAWYYSCGGNYDGVSRVNYGKKGGLAVRCIKDVAVDIDGNQYPLVTIGTQTWTKTNLNVTRYRNGDPIPQVQDPTQWAILTTGAWCYYNNDPANGATYGKLYNWYAVNDPRGLAPTGYHVPSDAEWTTLTTFLGGVTVAGNKMKATTGWAPYPGITNTNSSGFTGLPGGFRTTFGEFYDVGLGGIWWSSTEFETDFALNRTLYYISSSVGSVGSWNSSKKLGFSVRCIKD